MKGETKEEVTVSYKVTPENAAEITGEETIKIGDDLIFYVSPKEGYGIVSVTANGEELSLDDDMEIESDEYEYEIADVQSDVDIVVTMEQANTFAAFAALEGSLPDFAEEPWCTIDYQTTSPNVTADVESITEKDGVLYCNITIDEAAEGDLTIVFSDLMIEALNKYYNYLLPGDSYNMVFVINNQSKHSYVYKDGSAVIATPDTRGMETLENPPIAFDGQMLPRIFTGARTPNSAIQNLVGVNKSSNVTLRHMLTIYDKLEEAGYTGNDALTNYYLNFYNEKYGTQATTIAELPTKAFAEITNVPSSANGIYTVYYDGSIVEGDTFDEVASNLAEQYPMFDKCGKISKITNNSFKVQFYEPESQLSSLTYNKFYQELMCYTIGRTVTHEEANTWTSLAPVGMYLDESNSALDDVNAYLNEAISLDQPNSSSEIVTGMYLNGPKMGNAYMNYDFAWYAAIELTQNDGDLVINKVDESGNKIISPASFNLYKMGAEGTPLYYAQDGGWTPNQAEAKVIVTSEGSANISGLPAGAYYLIEVAAPEGYEKATAVREFYLEPGGTTVNFTNAKIPVLGEYTITINYYEKGTTTKLHDSVSQLYKEAEGLAYDVTALVTGVGINGYTYDSWENLQQAGLNGTIGQNLVFNVYYTKNTTTPDPDPTPSTRPSGGGGGGSSSGTKPGRGTSTPEGGPGVTTTIENQEVPMAPAPTTTIPETEVPLAPLPKTGDTSGTKNGMLLLASGLVMAMYLMFRRKEEQE